jgi:hypothetical protein
MALFVGTCNFFVARESGCCDVLSSDSFCVETVDFESSIVSSSFHSEAFASEALDFCENCDCELAPDTFDLAAEHFDSKVFEPGAFECMGIPSFRASDTFDLGTELFDSEAFDPGAFEFRDISSFRTSDTFELATIALNTPRLAFVFFFVIHPNMLFLLPAKPVALALFVGACNSFVTRESRCCDVLDLDFCSAETFDFESSTVSSGFLSEAFAREAFGFCESFDCELNPSDTLDLPTELFDSKAFDPGAFD